MVGDLTPTHTELGFDGKPSPAMKTSGGMPTFLQFVQKELIPHIDSAYRTAPYRVFVGHSLGGITTIDAIYTMPETFNAYVAIDPSLWWDNGTLLKQAKERFSKPLPANRVLYVGQANTLNPDDDHLRNDVRAVDAGAEDLQQAGDRVEVRVAVEQIQHGVAPRRVRGVVVRWRRVDPIRALLFERGRREGVDGSNRDGIRGCCGAACLRVERKGASDREREERGDRGGAHYARALSVGGKDADSGRQGFDYLLTAGALTDGACEREANVSKSAFTSTRLRRRAPYRQAERRAAARSGDRT